MSAASSFSTVANLLLWVACFVLGTSSPAAAAATESEAARHLPWAATGQAGVRYNNTPPVAGGKVDVFLDLACPDSAAAWTTIKQVVSDYGFRMEFVFHVLPISQHQGARDAAKAMQVVRMYSAGNEECALFVDAMLDHQNLAMLDNEADDDMTRLVFFDEVLVKAAVAGGSVTEDQFERDMEDPLVDRLVTSELEAAGLLGVHATPAVVLNGVFMMRLVGPEKMRDFELFVARGMTPQPMADSDREAWRASVEGNGNGIGEEGTDHEDRFGLGAALTKERSESFVKTE